MCVCGGKAMQAESVGRGKGSEMSVQGGAE